MYLQSREETQNCWQCPYSWSLRKCKSLNNRSHLVQKWSCECLPASVRHRPCTTWESAEAHRSLCTPSSLHPPPTVWRANFRETSASCNVWEWLIWESRMWRFDRDRWKPRTSTRPELTQRNSGLSIDSLRMLQFPRCYFRERLLTWSTNSSVFTSRCQVPRLSLAIWYFSFSSTGMSSLYQARLGSGEILTTII